MKLKIGIFDSGIGGFTVLNSLLKTRKDVEVFYLADTKRIPYGNKNLKEIRLIAQEICNFFLTRNMLYTELEVCQKVQLMRLSSTQVALRVEILK